MAKKVSIDELSDSAKKVAVQDFIGFYFDRYKVNNLEIISMYKVDYFLTDLNHFVFENQGFTPQQIKDALFDRRSNSIVKVISTIDPEYYDTGKLVVGTWDDWYDQQFEKISSRD
ncbi:hypothetical protein [Lentilactobacillus sp. Marseille-Q4993]|uniref:hypothetical protein n=1 Tax=Lentilactobacillus sp. Marseille-Q4993 TaxID=3039492 RepID=UPI0024BC1159|nr:hypothetical protein [Lentilactobacillus sp. Marseille-Q4993]